MNAKVSKALRRAIYNESVGNTDSSVDIRDAKSVEDAYLYYVQRSVYQRTKKVLASRIYRGAPELLFAEAVKAIKFLVDGFKNKQGLKVDSGEVLTTGAKDDDSLKQTA